MVHNTLQQDTLQHNTLQHTAQGFELFGWKTLILNVSMHITTYNINSSTSVNFIPEYVSITLSIESTFLYLLLLKFIFNTVYVNWLY